MAAHSHIIIWKIPWTEEPGRLQSPASPNTTEPARSIHVLALGLVRSVPIHPSPSAGKKKAGGGRD